MFHACTNVDRILLTHHRLKQQLPRRPLRATAINAVVVDVCRWDVETPGTFPTNMEPNLRWTIPRTQSAWMISVA
jgi:hypothetical protein